MDLEIVISLTKQDEQQQKENEQQQHQQDPQEIKKELLTGNQLQEKKVRFDPSIYLSAAPR